jgi:tetratricopeptide (TPR) repeat protein
MEGKKCKLIALFLLMLSTSMFAEDRSDIYKAYVSNRMDLWKAVIDRIESSKPSGNETILELINYEYGYIGYCLGFNKEKEAEKYLTLAENNTSKLEKVGYKPSLLHAYRSAFYGFRISLNKISAPVNGRKSLNHAKSSIELDDNNYLGHLQYGNALFYMPAAFGGSKKEALEYFGKARMILEKNPSALKGDWNYLNLLVIIAQSYESMGQYSCAKAEYDNILKLEPELLYVKNDLLPKMLAKMK